MRRLPVYLVLDTSSSMYGEPILAVQNGLDMLVSTLRQDPYALETAFLSVITFDTDARQVSPLTELTDFEAPLIEAKGATALGQGLSLTAACIQREIKKTSADQKGDWKPLIFLMTDGAPTDSWKKGADALRLVQPGLIVCCAAGRDAKVDVLEQISEAVVLLDVADSNTIAAFFKWVSASITTSSRRIDLSKEEVGGIKDLPSMPAGVNLKKPGDAA